MRSYLRLVETTAVTVDSLDVFRIGQDDQIRFEPNHRTIFLKQLVICDCAATKNTINKTRYR